jgi:cyanophycinase
VELAGGPESPIVVLPTARADPIPERPGDVLMLQRAGARNVKVLRGRTLSEVEAPEFLETLREARGIWFGGGRQWRFVDAYLDTRAHELFREVLRRGGVIGGSSAGASIQAEYLARGSPLGNRQIMAEGYERGLGFLGGVAIDQHFSQRGRLPDMTALVRTYPQLLGIGIDESTALIVQGHVAEVMGRHRVCFYNTRKPVKSEAPDYEALTAGGLYDLKARKIIKKPKKRMRV